MNIGDDITVNAVIVDITENNVVIAKTKQGRILIIRESDINTIRPKVETSGVDHRKGN